MDTDTFPPVTSPDNAIDPHTYNLDGYPQRFEQIPSTSELRTHHHHHRRSPRRSSNHHSHRRSRTNRHHHHTKHRDRRHSFNQATSSPDRSTSSPSHRRKHHHRNRKSRHSRPNAHNPSHSHSNYYSKSHSHSHSHSHTSHISSREYPSDFNPEPLSPQPRTNLSTRGLHTEEKNDILAKRTKEACIDKINESAFKEAVLNKLISSMEQLQTHVCLTQTILFDSF